MRAIGIAIPFFRRRSGVPIDAQAQVHYNRVIADGGVVPSGLSGVNAFFSAVKAIYGTSDINTAISAAYDAHYLGYKLGAGSGTTLGQAAQKLYSCSGASGDVTQTTAASQPLLLAHSGENYYWSTGLTSDYVSTPNASGNQLINDCALEVISRNATVNATTKVFCAKRAGSTATTFSYQFVFTSNLLSIVLSNGTTIFSYDSTTTVNSASIGFRFSRNATTGIIKFFESLDGVNYTQLGSNIAGFTGTIFNLNAITTIGNNIITSNPVKIEKCLFFKDDTFTTATQIFNPASYNPSVSQTQWTSATGEVWSISTGTATTGYKGHLCTKTIIQGDGVDDRMSTSLPTYQYITRYASVLQYTMANGVRILAGTGAAHLLYNFVNPNIRAFNGVDLDFNNETVNRLQLFTANYNSLTSTGLLNNANTASGDTGTLTSLLLSILSNSTPTQFANASITTIIQANQVDNTAQNTAIYQYIRSINNNAF